MLARKKERLKIEVAQLDDRIRLLQRRRKLLGSEEYLGIMEPWLVEQIEPLRAELEWPDLSPGGDNGSCGMSGSSNTFPRSVSP